MNSVMFLEEPKRSHLGRPVVVHRQRQAARATFTPAGADLAMLLALTSIMGSVLGLVLLIESLS
jgi:hypothetical protein